MISKALVPIAIIFALVMVSGCILIDPDPYYNAFWLKGEFTVTDQDGNAVADATAVFSGGVDKGEPKNYTSDANGNVKYEVPLLNTDTVMLMIGKDGCDAMDPPKFYKHTDKVEKSFSINCAGGGNMLEKYVEVLYNSDGLPPVEGAKIYVVPRSSKGDKKDGIFPITDDTILVGETNSTGELTYQVENGLYYIWASKPSEGCTDKGEYLSGDSRLILSYCKTE